MDLSSLILLAIIGVWVAYLVPHWLHRREELAQSHTTDRFSGGLRVLQRRSRKPRPDRSGDAVLTSPRVVVDADGEYLYIPADRALAARMEAERQSAERATAARMPAEPQIIDESEPAAEVVPGDEAVETSAVNEPEPSRPEAEMPERPYDLEVAIESARAAARRRALIMATLFVATVVSGLIAALSALSGWIALPASVLLLAHVLASRVAGLRSREALMLLAVHVHTEERDRARAERQALLAPRPAEVAASVVPEPVVERVARRAAAVGADTWEPVPVPPPTYTLKPAVQRPEPAPLDLPAAAVSRGALPRRAADVERILALESHLDELFEEPKVVNG